MGAVALLVFIILLFLAAIHFSFRAPRLANEVHPSHYDLKATDITIEGEKGKRIAAWWVTAEKPCDTTIVIVHGWGANKSLMLPLALPFQKLGYNLLLIDVHNHGDSEARGVSNMPKFAEDAISSINWLKQHQTHASQKIILLGHSVGAAAVLLAAANGAKADLVIAIASFVHPRIMMQRALKKVAFIPGLVPLLLNYVQWVIGHSFDEIAPITSVQKIQQPCLLVHGTADTVIPLADFHLLCEVIAATQAKQIEQDKPMQCLEIPLADHDSIDKIEDHFKHIAKFIQQKLGSL